MIFLLAISLIWPILAGFLVVSLCWPNLKASQSLFTVKLWLSVGVGFGISSLNYFLSLLLTGSANHSFIASEIAILLALIGVRLYTNRSIISVFQTESDRVTTDGSYSIVPVVFYTMLIFSIIGFILKSLKSPHGGWDAWSIWNMRARFLFKGGVDWKNAFSNLLSWSHPDYPLLIPTNVARLWSYIGKEIIASAPLIAFVFTFATLGLLVSSLIILRGRTQGSIGGLILLGTPFFIEQGASQYADVPLGFYILATVVLLNLQDEISEKKYGLLYLAGMTVGFATWTKNEGALFLVGIIVARSAIILTLKTRGVNYRRETQSFILGIVPILLTILYFKTYLAPPNDLMFSQGVQQTTGKLTDFSRYSFTGLAFLTQIIRIHSIPLAVLPIYFMLLGVQSKQLKRPGVVTSLLVLFLMFGGYFFVYITSPYDLTWHLKTSLDRLFLQLWPSVIFSFLMFVASPEETVDKGCMPCNRHYRK